jgi:hypothetical protein
MDRREVLRIGAVSVLAELAPRASAASASDRQCLFMLLQGGPSHLDLWDLKPDAPAEVRGPFQPISTKVPGVVVSELLPRTAALMDKICLVRSMEHRFSNHIAGTYVTLTGSNDQPDADREAKADDFPGPGAVLQWMQRTPSPIPTAVSLPTWLSIPGPSNRMPGQYAGLLGSSYDPFLVSGKPEDPAFAPMQLSTPQDVGDSRFHSRVSLLKELDATSRGLENQAVRTQSRLAEAAYGLLTDPRVRLAIDLSRESDRVRDRYGRTKLGQSLLLARRLLEAGVRMVSFNEFNQAWDHHGAINNTLRDRVPPLDQAYSALITDLSDRGMLDRTLVIHAGEFGRTPIINKDGGRDHWPFAYTTILAGGGVHGGMVHGASDARGAYVKNSPVSPADLLATMWHCLGVDPATELRDRLGRPIQLCQGSVVSSILV